MHQAKATDWAPGDCGKVDLLALAMDEACSSQAVPASLPDEWFSFVRQVVDYGAFTLCAVTSLPSYMTLISPLQNEADTDTSSSPRTFE